MAYTTWDWWNSGTSTTTSTNITVWDSWTSANTTATGFYTQIWDSWNRRWIAYTPGAQAWEPAPDTRTEAQKEESRRQALQIGLRAMWARWVREAKQYWIRVERAAAQLRAKELLLECLDDTQREEYTSKGYFHVHTKDGTRKYRINQGNAGNVRLVEERGKPVQRLKRYCIHTYDHLPGGFTPDEDNMLAQKLMLETDEERFLQVANAS